MEDFLAGTAFIGILLLALSWRLTAVAAAALALHTILTRRGPGIRWGRWSASFGLGLCAAVGYAVASDETFSRKDPSDPCPGGGMVPRCDGPPEWIFFVIAVCALLLTVSVVAGIAGRIRRSRRG
ncbi:hypothetical protein [Thermostaphylospora chromogena]|jgi:hypothetical protein|uniref:Uncharacterized protein n=1 Tax=Thermostaphylospora chromogena TaxID=35622 RepID=A0A1H1H8K1_9ACTN|nr:hypothetical protein [Thermostaphylospora chromogena]SDR21764.1 hypothetical protein SAMN04489764_4159 [Thermostaphylospora chromogena]